MARCSQHSWTALPEDKGITFHHVLFECLELLTQWQCHNPQDFNLKSNFLNRLGEKVKYVWITCVMKICTFLDRTRDYKSWDWIQFVNFLIKHFCTHRKLVQTLFWSLSTHKNITIFKKLPLFMSSSSSRRYNLLHPLLLLEHGNTSTSVDGQNPQYNFTKQFRYELLEYSYFVRSGYVWHTHDTGDTGN